MTLPVPNPSQNLRRFAEIAAELPESECVVVEGWGGEPTFRVRGKVFVFVSPPGTTICVKLPRDEAAAVVASDDSVVPMRFGLGRHGWIQASVRADEDDEKRWQELTEWVRISYTLVAPKSLARRVDDAPSR
ncbi:MmcQ/YjbR family DNA-binding protein [Micromonospora sp. NPDC049891]|uniref:MmcQ/YjbR family DNA-binding protein n=1 Tax=Micromonospora sp. NPDC049891 TaxID=3155655 RepID=UPI0033FE6B88